MPSNYLESSDYAAYGVTASSNTAVLVTRSSEIIDNFISRIEGLIYVPDINGMPLYMQKPVSQSILTITEDLSPGSNINVTVTGPYTSLRIGLAGIIDIDDDTAESVVVTAINGNVVTLNQVNFAHSSGAQIQFGLMIEEEISLPSNRSLTKLSKWPVANILALHGRYGYTRGYNVLNSLADDLNVLAINNIFGGPPAWEMCTPSPSMWDANTGELWVPAGIMNAYFTQIRVQYVAGYTYASLPSAIKMACANIVNNIVSGSIAPGTIDVGIKSYAAGDTKIERFSNTLIDANTSSMLQPFCARLFV